MKRGRDMDCHLEEVYADGRRNRIQTHPNGHPNSVYPSRGWAQASAMQHVDSWGLALYRADNGVGIPVSIDVVLESDGSINKSFKIR